MTYGILVAESIRELEEAVNWMLGINPEWAWAPLGGPFQAQHGSYCQAVSRPARRFKHEHKDSE